MACPEIPPEKDDCQKCILPRLDFMIVESKTFVPAMALKEAPDPGGAVEESKEYVSIDNSRLWGVHPTISSTVLRI